MVDITLSVAVVGLMMMLDIPYERGLWYADMRWGDDTQCNFPLFSWLSPLPLQWMYAVYWIMMAGISKIIITLSYFLYSLFLPTLGRRLTLGHTSLNIGCNFAGINVSLLAYADDIVLLAPSWRAL